MLVLAAVENVSVLEKSYCCIIRAFLVEHFVYNLINDNTPIKLCPNENLTFHPQAVPLLRRK